LHLRSKPLHLRSKPMLLRSKPMLLRSKPLHLRSKPMLLKSNFSGHLCTMCISTKLFLLKIIPFFLISY
jgi:hypothetical protein